MRKPGVLPVELEVEVAFHDVDLARIAWHGHYLKYLENARWILMDRLGYGLQAMIDAGEGWPIVDLQVKYLRPSRFRDRLKVRAALVEWETRLVVNYLITHVASSERVLRAQTTQVVVDAATGTLRYSLPEAFVGRVSRALADRDGTP